VLLQGAECLARCVGVQLWGIADVHHQGSAHLLLGVRPRKREHLRSSNRHCHDCLWQICLTGREGSPWNSHDGKLDLQDVSKLLTWDFESLGMIRVDILQLEPFRDCLAKSCKTLNNIASRSIDLDTDTSDVLCPRDQDISGLKHRGVRDKLKGPLPFLG